MVTNNFLFLEQRKREKDLHERNVLEARVDLGASCSILSRLSYCAQIMLPLKMMHIDLLSDSVNMTDNYSRFIMI